MGMKEWSALKDQIAKFAEEKVTRLLKDEQGDDVSNGEINRTTVELLTGLLNEYRDGSRGLMKVKLLKASARAMALRTEDAYSAPRYENWRAVAEALYEQGWDDRQVEAILRSKWTRYAADEAGKNTGATAEDLLRWMRKNKIDIGQVNRLVAEM